MGVPRRHLISLEGQESKYAYGLGVFMEPGPRGVKNPYYVF